MFSHMLVGSNDVAPRAKAFYDAVLGALGVASATPDPRHRLMHWHRGALFLVGPPLNGEKATVANGGTIGFACDSEAQVDARHAAGIAHGGMKRYLAYLRDPDGHNLCALYRPGCA